MATVRSTLAILFVSLLAWGCATTPAGKYNQMNEPFIAAVKSAVTAKQTGSISQEDWDAYVLPAINEGNQVLVQMREVVDSGGDPTDLEFILQVAIETIEQYLE